MAKDLKYRPVSHNHEEFLKKAGKREGFKEVYEGFVDEYALARELLQAWSRAGLTQEAVAERMGTTRAPISAGGCGKPSPSVTTLKKYALAVGCEVEIRLVPATRKTARSTRAKRRRAGS